MIKIISGFNTALTGPRIVTLGTFDGVHLGHRKILDEVKARAAIDGGHTTVITFYPHPRLVLKPEMADTVKLLTDIDEKVDLLNRAGIDDVIVLRFTPEFAKTDYKDFVRKFLVERIGMTRLIIGYDHAFGNSRSGTYNNLKILAEQLNFGLQRVEPHVEYGQTVSSSIIRGYLNNGDLENAKKLLGRPYCVFGKIVGGDGRGRQLNFPTANIVLKEPHKVVPKTGVYAVDVNIKSGSYKGMMNIGTRPTFGENELTLEVHILDFDEMIYGENINITFKKRLRDEKKFTSVDELIKQLKRDRALSAEL